MIYPPHPFDLNEWIVICFLLSTGWIAWCLPHRFPPSLTLVILFFSVATSRVFDHILAGPVMGDLYDVQDLNKIEWADLLTYVMYAPSGYIFVYVYDKYNLRKLKTPLYVLCWAILSSGIEWLMHLGHVFTYKEWSIKYSFLVYLFVQPLTLWMFEFLKARHRKTI
ncbi:MAG: hypothetical protein ACXVDE_02040 [Tumebacillaceae bacterium]